MQSLKKSFAYILMLFAFLSSINVSLASSTKAAVVYGTPFYPSDYTPEMMVYARNVETGETYSLKVAQDAEKYKMTLPAPATYIFFSWTTDKIGYFNDVDIKMGAVLSECDGSSNVICDHDNSNNHFPRPIKLIPGQIVNNLEISNYYYPPEKTYLFVPTP